METDEKGNAKERDLGVGEQSAQNSDATRAAVESSNSSGDPLSRDTQSASAVRPGPALAGKYDYLSVIAQTGLSIIYKARHDGLDKTVAIKMLNPEAHEKVSLAPFQHEARVAYSLTHPNLISILDFGTTDKGPFVVMDYVDGINLAELIKQEGPLKFDRALRIFKQLAEAASEVHEKGIEHIDLKPTNVIVCSPYTDDEQVKLVHFSFAKFARKVDPDGNQYADELSNLSYFSPEQCLTGNADVRSDVYSLGCIIYETLTGKAAFSGASAKEVIEKHTGDFIPLLSEETDVPLPEDAERIVAKCLAKSAKDRYQDCNELLMNLQAVIDQRPLPSQLPTMASSRRRMFTVAAIVVLQVIIASIALFHLMNEGSTQTSRLRLVAGARMPPPGMIDPQVVDDAYVRGYLASCGSTDKLVLSNCQITEGVLTEIGGRKELKVLYLDDTCVHDGSLAKLAGLPDLWYLNLDYTDLTDESVEYLQNLKSVSSLHIKGTRITKAGVEKLQLALPACEIEHNAAR